MFEAGVEWRKIDSKGRIVFVRSGDGWATFGDNALSVGNALGIKVTEEDGAKSVFFVDDMIWHYCVDLIKTGLRVVLIKHSLL